MRWSIYTIVEGGGCLDTTFVLSANQNSLVIVLSDLQDERGQLCVFNSFVLTFAYLFVYKFYILVTVHNVLESKFIKTPSLFFLLTLTTFSMR